MAPSLERERCTGTTVSVGTEWSEATIDLATVCPALAAINAVTADNPGPTTMLFLDDVRFGR